jgi:hypothetical protein
MKKIIVLAIALLATPALAQQQPSPALLEKAIASIQNQRNNALDALAATEARAAIQAEELAKAKARITELETPKKD